MQKRKKSYMLRLCIQHQTINGQKKFKNSQTSSAVYIKYSWVLKTAKLNFELGCYKYLTWFLVIEMSRYVCLCIAKPPARTKHEVTRLSFSQTAPNSNFTPKLWWRELKDCTLICHVSSSTSHQSWTDVHACRKERQLDFPDQTQRYCVKTTKRCS